MKETEGKKIVGESCERRLNNIAPELEPFEIKEVEQKIKALKELLGGMWISVLKHVCSLNSEIRSS